MQSFPLLFTSKLSHCFWLFHWVSNNIVSWLRSWSCNSRMLNVHHWIVCKHIYTYERSDTRQIREKHSRRKTWFGPSGNPPWSALCLLLHGKQWFLWQLSLCLDPTELRYLQAGTTSGSSSLCKILQFFPQSKYTVIFVTENFCNIKAHMFWFWQQNHVFG